MTATRRTMLLIATLAAATLFSCKSPPPPMVDVIIVDAQTEHWQSQITGAAPNSGMNVKAGDKVTLAIDGKITYSRGILGLTKKTCGPWGDTPPSPDAWCTNARIGALVWRVGNSGPCISLDKVSDSTFTAETDGQLQFLVNDIKGSYGDNSGSFRVTVTVQRK